MDFRPSITVWLPNSPDFRHIRFLKSALFTIGISDKFRQVQISDKMYCTAGYHIANV